jgi:hypothetical protein
VAGPLVGMAQSTILSRELSVSVSQSITGCGSLIALMDFTLSGRHEDSLNVERGIITVRLKNMSFVIHSGHNCNNFFLTISSAFAVECVALLSSKREVLGLNLVPKGYLSLIFPWFSSAPPGKCFDSTSH